MPIALQYFCKCAELRNEKIQNLLRKKKRELLFFEKFNAAKI